MVKLILVGLLFLRGVFYLQYAFKIFPEIERYGGSWVNWLLFAHFPVINIETYKKRRSLKLTFSIHLFFSFFKLHLSLKWDSVG